MGEVETLIKIDEVATRLTLTKREVQGLVRAKKIPVIRLNKRTLRFRWSEVEAAINRLNQREIK